MCICVFEIHKRTYTLTSKKLPLKFDDGSLRFAIRETIFWKLMICVRLCIYTNARTHQHPNNCLLKFHDGSHRFAIRETIFWKWMMYVRLCIYTNAHTHSHPNNRLLKLHDGSHRFAIRETIYWKLVICNQICNQPQITNIQTIASQEMRWDRERGKKKLKP